MTAFWVPLCGFSAAILVFRKNFAKKNKKSAKPQKNKRKSDQKKIMPRKRKECDSPIEAQEWQERANALRQAALEQLDGFLQELHDAQVPTFSPDEWKQVDNLWMESPCHCFLICGECPEKKLTDVPVVKEIIEAANRIIIAGFDENAILFKKDQEAYLILKENPNQVQDGLTFQAARECLQESLTTDILLVEGIDHTYWTSEKGDKKGARCNDVTGLQLIL